jgi:hypothetical protein
MHAFKRESANYTFELNDKSLQVGHKNEYGKMTRFDYEGYTEYGYNKRMPYILIIENFMEKIKSQEASAIIQLVLSAFYHTFEKHGDQREQLRKGLRYFALAEHYGVLNAAFPQEVLDGARAKYDSLKEKLEGLNNDFVISEQMVKKFHINEPMVASTGLIVYAALNDNWVIFETNERHKDIPEYLFSVLHHYDFKLVTQVSAVFTGTQNECQQYVRIKQKDTYGISLDEFKAIERKIEVTQRLVEDLEILLDIPYDQTLHGIKEIKEREEAVQTSVATNLQHLNLL